MPNNKFNEQKPFMLHAKYYHEKLCINSDIDYTRITNDRAKHILGLMFKLPSWLQTRTLNDLEKLGLIKRNGQREISLLPV